MKKFVCAACMACLCMLIPLVVWAQNEPVQVSIVPRPLKMEVGQGFYRLTEKSVIGFDRLSRAQAVYLQEVLERSTGWRLALSENKAGADIHLKVALKEVNHSEGYTLKVDAAGITVCGADEAGVFYGIQSLLQLLPSQVYSTSVCRGIDWVVPQVYVCDAPERPWRGMMLDVARYFYDKEFVMKYIDMMAMYKLNKLQLHLIDDSGWRLEIKKYPRLTEVGAWAHDDAERMGGYYTQEDIKELIAYARLRNVEIIPEIEFPAHMLSAIVAYPWLSCTGEQHQVPDQHFISRDLLCVGKESSYRFLADVLEETVALFPSSYINIGGDEAVYTRWQECPRCRAVMEREGLKEASQLQGYLTNVVSDMMKKKQRTVIGWEEIIQRGQLDNQVVALIWHNVADTLQAATTGHKAILCPATHMYLDFPESNTPGEIKAATWMPPISLEKCYSMEVNDYSPASTVLGIQGCFWTDQFIHGTVLQELAPLNENRSEKYAEYLSFPRMLAISEVAWCRKADRDFGNFSRRLSRQFAKLDYKDCHYRVPEPKIVSVEQTASGGCTFTLEPSVEGARILYTADGRYPTVHSLEYKAPVTVGNKSDFRAITVVSNRHYSLPIYFAPDYSAYKALGTFTYKWTPGQLAGNVSSLGFDCTGKISGNGSYELTLVCAGGSDKLKLGKLKLFKRDEVIAEVSGENLFDATHAQVAYRFQVTAFEAGTPFSVQIEAECGGGMDIGGLVFIRKN